MRSEPHQLRVISTLSSESSDERRRGIRFQNLDSLYVDQRFAFWNRHPDATGSHTAPVEGSERLVPKFWRDGNEQAARCLRIEEQVAKFLRDSFREAYAIAQELPVIFQAAGEKAFACGLFGAGQITDRGVIDLE